MESQLYQELATIEDQHWWWIGRRRLVSSLMKRYTKTTTHANTVEIGCGTGGNLRYFKPLVANIVGVEMEETAIALAQKKDPTTQIYEGKLPHHIPLEHGAYDIVFLLDVLEHIDEDGESLIQIQQLLTDNGHVIINVPAFMFLWSAHDELHHHKRRYTKQQLQQLLEKSGYTVKFISYTNFFIFFPVVIVRYIKKMLGSNTSDTKPSSKWTNRLLLLFNKLEILLLRWTTLPFGTSVTAIAHKH